MSREEQLRTLINRLIDQTITAEECGRLTDWLHGDPESCEIYLNAMTLEAHLHTEAGAPINSLIPGFDPVTLSGDVKPNDRLSALYRICGLGLLAASVLVLVFSFGRSMSPIERAVPVTAGLQSIATVIFEDQCRWQQPEELLEGFRIAPGRLHLSSGTAILRMDGGAELVLRGGSIVNLISSGSAALEGGDVTVHATGEAVGFRLHTPAGELLDLGTEFSASIDAAGVTEVRVIDGEVAVGPGATRPNSGATVIRSGETLRLVEPLQRSEMPSKREPRIEELLEQLRPSAQPERLDAHESFAYVHGVHDPENLSGGFGWDAPWRLRYAIECAQYPSDDATTTMKVGARRAGFSWPVSESMSMAGPAASYHVDSTHDIRVRAIANPIDMAQDRVRFVSILMHEPMVDVNTFGDRFHSVVKIAFRSSDDYRGECVSFQLDAARRPKLMFNNGIQFGSLAALPGDVPLLWVGKIVSKLSGEDEIFFRILTPDDPIDFMEPRDWHIVSKDVHLDAALDLLVLSATGPLPRQFDEIRIGPTWRSVMPQPGNRLDHLEPTERPTATPETVDLDPKTLQD